MSFRKDVDEMMKNVQVDYEMTNNIMNNTVRNSGKNIEVLGKSYSCGDACNALHRDNGSWS